MTYASQASLIARFGVDEITQISDLSATGAIDPVRVAQVLTDTSNTIDSYIASRYPLPLASVPARLESLACDIARYLLSTRPTDEMRRRYEDALAWLARVADGKYGLGLDQTGQETPSDNSVIAVSANDRVFSKALLGDYIFPYGVLP